MSRAGLEGLGGSALHPPDVGHPELALPWADLLSAIDDVPGGVPVTGHKGGPRLPVEGPHLGQESDEFPPPLLREPLVTLPKPPEGVRHRLVHEVADVFEVAIERAVASSPICLGGFN